jgi:pantoate--beta-alanine ligase
MKIIRSPRQMQAVIKRLRAGKKTIGFVPTMGALHKGHSRLIRCSRRDNDITVVSIFVNPAQFGPQKDFKRYPRPLSKDISFCKKAGVDFIFYPSVAGMYAAGCKTYVYVEELSNLLCGKSRPGHFRGVATVVAKLFNIVGPDNAYFGQKDAQQVVIIKRMAVDLNIPVKIRVVPTIRERGGLALSSRNLYLSSEERKDALVLYASLKLAKKLVSSGVRNAAGIISAMKRLISSKKSARIDYIAVVDPDNLKPVKRISNGSLTAVAVWIGKTRLIDNICLKY